MTPLELHYTSAEQGLGGSPGFQFIQLSANLDPGICRQVEPLLAYEPPRTAPSQPTTAEIASFPVALSHTLLAGGAAVLCNSSYTGTDYSGRFGNFYAHALYLRGGPSDLGVDLPIDMWASPSWCSRPTASGLPAAPQMEPGTTITRDILLAFTRERRDEVAAVLSDIANSFGRNGLQVILAENGADSVALWIATACRSLPRALAQRLTFTTYTRRPYQSSQQVIGIIPGADFSFTYTELTSQYRVHAQPGPSSPPAEALTWASTAAAIWLAEKPELFDAAYTDVFLPDGSPVEAWTDTLAQQLAATALASGVDLPQAAINAAATLGITDAGARRTPQFWQGLAAGFARSSSQIPMADLGRLCQQAETRHHPAEVTGPLLTAYLSRLLSEITEDTALDLSSIHWVIWRLRGDPQLAAAAKVHDRVREAFSMELPISRALLLLQISDAAGIEDSGGMGATLLGPTLLADGKPAAEAAEFLSSTTNSELQMQVLDFLEDAARHSGGRAAAGLVNGASRRWILSTNLNDFPLLASAARLAIENGPSRVAAFRRAATLLSASDSHDLRYAYGLVWPDLPPTLPEACELLSGEYALPVLDVPGTAEAFTDLIRHARVIDAETIRLADLLRTRISPPDPPDRALVELVAITGLLRRAAAQPSDPGLPQEIPRAALSLLAAWPHPGPPRDMAADALLTILVAPSRLESAGISAQAELHTLVASGDTELIAAFAERARLDLPGDLARSPQLHANCFIMWRSEHGQPGDQAWPAARDGLMTGLLAAAARKMDDRTRELTAHLIEERSPGLGNEWLQLTQARGSMTQRPWLRLLYRRTR